MKQKVFIIFTRFSYHVIVSGKDGKLCCKRVENIINVILVPTIIYPTENTLLPCLLHPEKGVKCF